MALSVLLVGCSKSEGPVTVEMPKPVKTVVVEALDIGGVRRFPARIEGLSAYALWVTGSDTDEAGQCRKDEYDLNLQWSPTKGTFKDLALRLRYAVVEQHGGGVEDLDDLRLICNYNIDI